MVKLYIKKIINLSNFQYIINIKVRINKVLYLIIMNYLVLLIILELLMEDIILLFVKTFFIKNGMNIMMIKL